jgi:hypothetical protein
VSNPDPALAEDVAPAPACTNCGDARVDVYCAKCGEKQPGQHDLSVSQVAHDVVHELVHLDSKLFRTLRDLVRYPGLLTVEYFAGRKKRSISPLRLFLTLFAVQFIAYTIYKPVAVYSVETFTRFETTGTFGRMLESRAVAQGMPTEIYKERLDEKWRHNLSLLQLANILGLALALKILYRRRHMAEHLVLAAHLLSFVYLFSVALWPGYALMGYSPGAGQNITSLISAAIITCYSYFAFRRFYQSSKGRTIVKAILFYGAMTLVSMVVLFAALGVAILTLH